MSLIGLLLVVLIVCVILWATKMLLTAFGVGQPIANVVFVLVVLVCLIWLINQFGLIGAGPQLRLR